MYGLSFGILIWRRDVVTTLKQVSCTPVFSHGFSTYQKTMKPIIPPPFRADIPAGKISGMSAILGKIE
jgi:hypothetical protein